MHSDRANRRISHIMGHLSPQSSSPVALTRQIGIQNCSETRGASNLYPSVDGRQSKYARIHGDVSSEPVRWTNAKVEGQMFTHIIYEKSSGEGIAKVLRLKFFLEWVDYP